MTKISDHRRQRQADVRLMLQALSAHGEPVPSAVLAERLNLRSSLVVATLHELEWLRPPNAFPAGPLFVETGWVWVS